MERREQLEAILAVAQKKAATARKLNRKKRVAKRPVKVLQEEWQAAYMAATGQAPSAWTGKEGKLTKTLVGQYGFDRTLELFRSFLSTWQERARDHSLAEGSLPSLGYLFVIRDQLCAELDGKKQGPGPVPGHKRRGETDTEMEGEGPAEGWGSLLDSVDY